MFTSDELRLLGFQDVISNTNVKTGAANNIMDQLFYKLWPEHSVATLSVKQLVY